MKENRFGRYALLAWIVCCVLLTSVLLGIPNTSDGATQTPDDVQPLGYLAQNPSKDAAVNNGNPDSNFGSLQDFVGYDAGTGTWWTYIRFDVSSIPSDATIDTVDLGLYCYGFTGSSFTIGAYQAAGSWSESTITWNNQPGYYAGAKSSMTASGTGWYWFPSSSSIKSLVASWVSGSATNNGFVIANSASSGISNFRSREQASPPELDVMYTEAPPTYSVSFYPSDGGTITFDGSTYSYGDSTSVTAGTYSISANPASGYSFSSWSRTGGVSTPSGGTTTISGDGSLTANFVDNEPPTVSITYPSDGNTVSGTVVVTASASDNVGVTKVEFYLDNVIQKSDSTSPYTWSWDTATATDGSHTLKVIAYDAENNQQTDQITVNVDNGPPVLEFSSVIIVLSLLVIAFFVMRFRILKKQ